MTEQRMVPASEYDALCDLIRSAVPPNRRATTLASVRDEHGRVEREWLRRIFAGANSYELLADQSERTDGDG